MELTGFAGAGTAQQESGRMVAERHCRQAVIVIVMIATAALLLMTPGRCLLLDRRVALLFVAAALLIAAGGAALMAVLVMLLRLHLRQRHAGFQRGMTCRVLLRMRNHRIDDFLRLALAL